MRPLKFLVLAVALVSFLGSETLAAKRTPLKRSEVGQIKRTLVAVLTALGKPPPGYVGEDDSFSLPTEIYNMRNSTKFRPVFASVSRSFESDPGQAEGSEEKLTEELQSKMNAAVAKGDPAAM